MNKQARHTTIQKLIGKGRVGSQTELAKLLTKAGFAVTQASVSRDLDELGVEKQNGVYALPRRVRSEFGDVTFDTAAGSLIVGRCPSGMASAITVRIDAATIPDIVGTIAGDDTIFIAVKENNTQAAVLQGLRRLFE